MSAHLPLLILLLLLLPGPGKGEVEEMEDEMLRTGGGLRETILLSSALLIFILSQSRGSEAGTTSGRSRNMPPQVPGGLAASSFCKWYL